MEHELPLQMKSVTLFPPNHGRTWIAKAWLAVVLVFVLSSTVWAKMTVGELRCEYALNPVGIDTLQPRLSWTLNDDRRGQGQSAYQIRVAAASEELSQDKALLWNTGKVLSDQNTHVVYKGAALHAGARCHWQVRVWDKQGKASPWSAPARWQVALLQSSDWKAKWIGLQDSGKSQVGTTNTPPLPKDCPRLRKAFVLAKPVRFATASVCGLGFYELYLNGRKVGDHVLAPANTPYAQRLLFDTLDVTDLVKQGDNAAGLWLAAGYSDDYSKWGWKWELAKQAILQLDVVFQDGTKTTIVTDDSWQAGSSPITFASLYHGETYDAGLETPGWATAGFLAEGWQPVRVFEATAAKLAPNTMPPIRVIERIKPIGMSESKPGVFIFDMGQNIAGWVHIRAQGKRGARIVLRHSELMGADGLIDPWTNRDAKATDTFILRGESSETYEPRFTYHGFRYVEVAGYPGRPALDDITGCVVHADVQSAGTFVTSDDVINRIHSNCVWSMRGNFMSIPTDCCMRDERTPCQMDSQAYEDAALCNFWMDRYYTKWLGDIQGGRGNPDWNGDMVFLPWRLYQCYGDAPILKDNYENMRGFVEALHAKTPGHIYTEGFGDWCAPSDGSWEGYHRNVTEVNTSLYAAIARITGETAAILGKSEDAARYAGWSDEITRAFHEKCFDVKTATYGNGTQTAAILPLALNLTPREMRSRVFDGLVATIQGRNKGHLDTGIFATRYLMDVLCDFGQPDLAVSMLKQPTYPGFGDQIAQGATTLWEQWSFKGGMNSHNHAMFAGVDSSFFTRLAGITALKPGFAQIGIRPVIPKALTFAEATRETVKGRVAVRWQKSNGKTGITVTVPVNTTALVSIPADNADDVTESGRPAKKAKVVGFIGMDGDYAIFSVGSGNYHFSTSKP
jgi:alpha-L-rhamnosidase